MQATIRRCFKLENLSAIAGAPPYGGAAHAEGKLRRDRHILDRLVAVTRLAWDLGAGDDRSAGGQ